MLSNKILLLFLCCVLYTIAEKNDQKEILILQPEASLTPTYKTIAVITALTTVTAGLVVIAAWIVPLIAYKFCYLFGSCEYGLSMYVDQFLLARRQKRSVEYVGPLLQTLANAYEIYEGGDPNDQKKNFRKDRPYRR